MEKNNANAAGIKKIVIIGPESTGKSTLSELLAQHYNTEWVPEYARYYIDELDRPYEEEDLLKIAKGQLQWEDEKVANANQLLICDTDLIVIKVWAEHKYGKCDPFILHEIKTRKYDLYLLTNVDLPWEEDPQRENPELREYFMNIFRSELEKAGVPYVTISGGYEQRKQTAIAAIDGLIKD